MGRQPPRRGRRGPREATPRCPGPDRNRRRRARPPDADLDRPRSYTLDGDADVWEQLDLGTPPDDRPLYVGNAEDSLVSRHLRTRFATGKTGWSSPRAPFAALLADQLRFSDRPPPRHPE
jgi:hypothetical protein